MKPFKTTLLAGLMAVGAMSTATEAQAAGWPENYKGVILQGFYWNSFSDSKWTNLESQAADFAGYFDLVWVPQSGKCLNATSMGYDPYYFFNQNSSFGTKDELISMIKTFKKYGIGTLADVVVNHHNTTGWWTFPKETFNGQTYQLQTTDIVSDDDGGATLTQANKDGVTLSSNKDEGEGWAGMRDLDHKSTNVQNIVKAYERFLVDSIGYTGFRYDMVKGFSGSHVGDYNDAAGVAYSIGECWGSNSTIENWITATSKKSAAFDFQFRYNVRDAINNSNWSRLNSTNNLIHDVNYRQYAVTFVENHDTEYRSATSSQDPIKADTLAANAYMLAMPGTPCVFYKHYLAYPHDIKGMIDVRKAAGITNQSTYTNMRQAAAYYANAVTGTNGKLLVVVGSTGSYSPSSSSYTKVLSGYHYAYYLSNDMNIAFVDKPSGTYIGTYNVMLSAVTSQSGAQLVYTTDGSTPTASSTKVASGTTLSFSKDVTLKVGLLVNGTVSSVITRNYTYKEQEEETFDTPASGYTLTAYFLAPAEWTNTIKCWAWKGSTNYTGGEWPGEACYKIGKASDGRYIWQWCYYGSLTTQPTGIIFNNNGGSQTANMTFTNGGWYAYNSTASNPTLGISAVATDASSATTPSAVYNLQGQKVGTQLSGLPRGIYIFKGKKYVVR
jgi:alpha-amylase